MFLETIRKQARENNLLAGLLTSMIPIPISAFVVVPACMELGGFSTKTLVRQGRWISIILAIVQILWVMHVVTGEEFSLFSAVDLL